MAQRVSSDHPSVTTVDATLSRNGRTDRPRVDVPAEYADQFPHDEVVRLALDGTQYRAEVRTELASDGLRIMGAYDTPRLARNPGEGENRLAEWYRATDVDFGRTVHLDVVEEGFLYGLRIPGDRAVYEATESPAESLASIARDLESED